MAEQPCPNCEKLQKRIEELERRNAELTQKIDSLENVVQKLSGLLKMDSTNSSLPPSTDWQRRYPLRQPEDTMGRKREGQLGHVGKTETAPGAPFSAGAA